MNTNKARQALEQGRWQEKGLVIYTRGMDGKTVSHDPTICLCLACTVLRLSVSQESK